MTLLKKDLQNLIVRTRPKERGIRPRLRNEMVELNAQAQQALDAKEYQKAIDLATDSLGLGQDTYGDIEYQRQPPPKEVIDLSYQAINIRSQALEYKKRIRINKMIVERDARTEAAKILLDEWMQNPEVNPRPGEKEVEEKMHSILQAKGIR